MNGERHQLDEQPLRERPRKASHPRNCGLWSQLLGGRLQLRDVFGVLGASHPDSPPANESSGFGNLPPFLLLLPTLALWPRFGPRAPVSLCPSVYLSRSSCIDCFRFISSLRFISPMMQSPRKCSLSSLALTLEASRPPHSPSPSPQID